MLRQVSGMHIAHGLMRCQDFGLGVPNCKAHTKASSEIFEEGIFFEFFLEIFEKRD